MDRFDCQECGMNVDGREYHPYLFCVLFKNGIDPRHQFTRDIFERALRDEQPTFPTVLTRRQP